MPVSPTSAVVTDTGITAPPLSDILAYAVAKYQAIFGSDVLLDPSSQDMAFIAVLSQMVADANAVSIAIYNSFSPATASGNALASNVKINKSRSNPPALAQLTSRAAARLGLL